LFLLSILLFKFIFTTPYIYANLILNHPKLHIFKDKERGVSRGRERPSAKLLLKLLKILIATHGQVRIKRKSQKNKKLSQQTKKI
jgi:hypothetical protein